MSAARSLSVFAAKSGGGVISQKTSSVVGRERVKEAALGLIGDSFSEAEDGGREEKGEGI